MWIGVGSRHENEKNSGAGYFLEHLAFKVRSCARSGTGLHGELFYVFHLRIALLLRRL